MPGLQMQREQTGGLIQHRNHGQDWLQSHDPVMPKGGWQEFSSSNSLQRPAAATATTPKAQQMVRVQPTRGGKGGKTVTVIRGLELDAAGFKTLLKALKSKIGSGGTAKDGVIELQGDQVNLALELLAKEGYRPKRAGG